MIETEHYITEKTDGYKVAWQILLSRLEYSSNYEQTGSISDELRKDVYHDLIAAVRRLHAGQTDIETEIGHLVENPDNARALLSHLEDDEYRTDGRLYAYKAVELLACAAEISAENLLIEMRADVQENPPSPETEPELFAETPLSPELENGIRMTFADMAAKIRHDLSICVNVHHSLQDQAAGGGKQTAVAASISVQAARPTRH